MAASSAVQDGLLAMPPASIATSPDARPLLGHAAETFDQTTTGNLIDLPAPEQAAAMIHVPLPDPAAKATAKIDRSEALRPVDSTTEIAVQIAKDYQTRVLEDMKVSMNAALDYAKGLANTRMPTDAMSSATAEDNEGRGAAGSENGLLTALGAAAAYRAEAFELMKANMNTTLEYARQLVSVRKPSEFVELSSTHARKQFELILKQSSELRSLAQTVTKSDAT